MKKLVARKDITCMACLSCVRACSEAFYKVFDPAKSCIQIVDNKGEAKLVGKVIAERAVKAGIKIIGPAGNNNGADAREMNWMTGHKGCTIVGAYGKNAILKTSNIHADVYIKASSTSAAAARYVGMLAKGKIYDDYYK